MHHHISQLISDYGLIALFFGAGLEGESVVVLAGMMVHRSLFHFWPAVAVASAGSFIADQLFFMLGRKNREHRYVRKIMAKPAFVRALATFHKYPVLFVFGFRFVYGFRTISPIAIGTTSLSAKKFLVLNFFAAIVWSIVFVGVGYYFGVWIETFFGRIRRVTHVLLIGVLIVAVISLIAYAVHLYLSKRAHARGEGFEPLPDDKSASDGSQK